MTGLIEVIAARIELFTLTISYPLRMMATALTGVILNLFGIAVEVERTSISVVGREETLAITDACGGVDQLAGLIVVGAVFAWMMQKRWCWRAVHFLTIIPSVVIANTIRLVLTVSLLVKYGDVILGDTWHHALGWVQTVLVVTFIWLFGKGIKVGTDETSG